MYKICVKNLKTGACFWEYGFTRGMAKRIYSLMNEQDENTYETIYEIVWFLKLNFSLSAFKKCLTNKKEMV